MRNLLEQNTVISIKLKIGEKYRKSYCFTILECYFHRRKEAFEAYS